MSKRQTEVTIKVPKKLIDLLEAEDFLDWDREYFFEAAIRSLICSTCFSMDYDEEQKFYEKYGKEVGVIYPPEQYCS